jgi:hypothetical protein
MEVADTPSAPRERFAAGAQPGLARLPRPRPLN